LQEDWQGATARGGFGFLPFREKQENPQPCGRLFEEWAIHPCKHFQGSRGQQLERAVLYEDMDLRRQSKQIKKK